MGWVVDVATFYGVVVDVFDFLLHDVLVLDLLWVCPFLPNLKISVCFVFEFVVVELFEYVVCVFVYEEVDDIAGGVGFEVGYFFV